MKRNQKHRHTYLSPSITLFTLEIEGGIASGSNNAQLNFQDDNFSSPQIEEWSDNTNNLNDFSQDKWF